MVDVETESVVGAFQKSRAKDSVTHGLLVKLYTLQIEFSFMCCTTKEGETAKASMGERQPARLPAYVGETQVCAAQPEGRKTGTRLSFVHAAKHSRTEVRQSRVTRMHRPSILTPKSNKLDGQRNLTKLEGCLGKQRKSKIADDSDAS